MAESFIVAIRAKAARLSAMKRAVETQTGDGEPFFCPPVVEGQPYEGHAHTFPPAGANSASSQPIELKK